MNNKKLLKPKYDVVFQALFQNNKENITESLISDILGEKVKIIEIKADESLRKEYPDEKTGRLDLKTKFEDGTICQVEMQLADQSNIVDRILYYWARTFSGQIKVGEQYTELMKTIGIVIVDFELKEMEGIEKLNTKWQIMETDEGKKVLTEKLELRIIEIPKANRILEKERENRIAQWISFIDDPNAERIEEVIEKNEEIKKAKNVLYVMSEDEKLERLAFLKERAIMEEKTGLKYAEEKGRNEGMQEGIEKGKKEEKIEIAKKLKEEKIPIDIIIKTTGLTKEEIEKL